MDTKLTPLDKMKQCINESKCFVLQGGAGSGKTETLKQLLKYLKIEHPEKRVVCITHTNLAVDEIRSRVDDSCTISTIHAFLHSLIKDYKKNIRNVIYEIFRLSLMERALTDSYENENQQKKEEYAKYKNIYQKYAGKLFAVKGVFPPKVIGKKEYDLNPDSYNDQLNENIAELNSIILQSILEEDYNKIHYNETKFNSYRDLTYGHDSLLEIAYLLFNKYPIMGKILQDKYDLILIDEYQDTDEKVMYIFMKSLPIYGKTIIGLFGDSMQSIYSSGVGNAQYYIDTGILTPIPKEDNYRCSEQVVDFINQLRTDNIIQEVALKKDSFGNEESPEMRKGFVKLIYGIIENKPASRSSQEDKDAYSVILDILVDKAKEELKENYKVLLLTNKSIAGKAGFSHLFQVFNNRYSEVAEHIEEHLSILQLIDLLELCNLYEMRNYNELIRRLKKTGFYLKSVNDKSKLKGLFEKILSANGSAIDAIELAFKYTIIKKSERFQEYIARKNKFLQEVATPKYLELKGLYLDGKNTFTRMKKDKNDLTEEQFKTFEQSFKKERFFQELFSQKISFQEIKSYFQYMNEETTYITMHKTKGSGIENVIVVLDEYFWNEYDFSTIISTETSTEKSSKTQKLTYVACSRAKLNLICVRLILKSEEKNWKRLFPHNIEVDLKNLQ